MQNSECRINVWLRHGLKRANAVRPYILKNREIINLRG